MHANGWMRARALGVGVAALCVALACGESAGAPRSGNELWTMQGCITCHGKDGQGTPLAPSVRGAPERWKREQLVEYLRDPAKYIVNDARLKEQKKHYSQTMPVYGMLPKAELEALADFVIALP